MNLNTKDKTIFEKMQLLMDYIDLDSEIIPISTDNEIEQLFIRMMEGEPEQGIPEIVLKLMFLNDINKVIDKGTQGQDLNRTDLLQFYIDFPIKVTEKNIIEMSSLIIRFNSLIPVGGFGINDKNEVYFRYVLVVESRDFNAVIVTETLSLISFFIEILGSQLIELAEGRKSFQKSFEDGIKSLNQVVSE